MTTALSGASSQPSYRVSERKLGHVLDLTVVERRHAHGRFKIKQRAAATMLRFNSR